MTFIIYFIIVFFLLTHVVAPNLFSKITCSFLGFFRGILCAHVTRDKNTACKFFGVCWNVSAGDKINDLKVRQTSKGTGQGERNPSRKAKEKLPELEGREQEAEDKTRLKERERERVLEKKDAKDFVFEDIY